MKTILLLVDLQEDFLSEPGLRPHRAHLEAATLQLLKKCREQSLPVAHIQMSVQHDPDNRMEHWKKTGRWSCLAGSPGASAPSGLGKEPGETVFFKSGFSAFSGTTLQDWLRDEGVDRVWIAGLHWHTCIRQTALDAYQMGFHVVLCQDALAGTEPLQAAQTRLYLGKRGIPCLPTRDLFSPQTGSTTSASVTEKLTHQKVTSASPLLCQSGFTNRNQRARLLQTTASHLLEKKNKLSRLITEETGKPIRMSMEEVVRSSDLLLTVAARMAGEAEVEHLAEGKIRYLPRGLIGLITPWNNPLAIPAGQIAPALAYGNSVVWKPAPGGLKTAHALHACLIESGCPESSIGLLEGSSDAGLCLASHKSVDAVSFTGSSDAGWMVAAACHEQCRPLQAELGGNNGVILWPELEDPEQAARMLAEASFGFAGQRCTAVRRAIIPEVQLEEWMDRLQRSVRDLPWGSPMKEETVIGPLCSKEKAESVADLVQRSRPGVKLVLQPHLGTDRVPEEFVHGSAYYPPTLVVCSDPAHELVLEETFGPVLVLQPARDFDHALELLNGVRHGLTACLLGGNPDCRNLFLQKAQAGILKTGNILPGAGLDLPFGGWKDSGWGPPQHGFSNRQFYTKIQTLYC